MTTQQRITEYNKVELPLMQQLAAMGWETLQGDIDVPSFTYRESYREVLLRDPLKAALYHINRAEDGTPWLDDERVNMAINALDLAGKPRLMESNVEATRLLLEGTPVPGDPELHRGNQATLRFIDFDHPENNAFLAISQFRVDPSGTVSAKSFYVPDIVLFVNGIPLVVIECKAPGIPTPMTKAIEQLLQYSNQRGSELPEGIERLFWTNQAAVGTYYYMAKVSTIGASYEHYMEWKSTTPYPEERIAQEVQTSQLVSQHKLAGGMLRPECLLDLVRNFTLFKPKEGRLVKIVARYNQWDAVQEAIRRLRQEPTRLQDGEIDRRGGIVWHTQGSGKSLSMVFLVRKLRTLPDLRRFKVVVVTDRVDLEDQLSETMQLTGETVRRARNTTDLAALLRDDAPGLIFGMIQKYRRGIVEEREEGVTEEEGDLQRPVDQADRYQPLNTSTDILVLVDEAHRSHTDEWHANLMAALPNSARIGFTGTPILVGAQKKTHEIFGEYIDIYTIRQAEDDGATVPILYEGREVEAGVLDHSDLDSLFEANFQHLTPEQQERIKEKYAREQDVLEAEDMIRLKARDILEHYVKTVLPNGFKAQLVAVSRLAAVRYQKALAEEHAQLLARLDTLDPALAALPEDQLRDCDEQTRFLIGALKQGDVLRRLEFATVISADQHEKPELKPWTDRARVDKHIERFKMPLVHDDPKECDSLAFLCVRTMLLTGFDAPVEQVLYLDRFMQGHELLQAIARVNRTAPGKTCGYVVDYYGVTRHLHSALAVYSQDDVRGAMQSIADELPRLSDRRRRTLDLFREHGIDDIVGGMDACVFLLKDDERVRAQFTLLFKAYLTSLDIVLPRPEALPYVDDAKQLGVISRTVANLLRDEDDQAIAGVGEKVRQLIDDHIRAYHIDLTIPPLSIMDARFDDYVEALPSSRARSAEMEHAARHEITVKFELDPVYYQKLSERLEAILSQFEDNWDLLADALRTFIQDMRSGPPIDQAARFLPGKEARKLSPFLSILIEEMGRSAQELSDDEMQQVAGVVVGMAAIIRDCIGRKDFWATPQLRNQLQAKLKVFLDTQSVLPYEQLDAAADRFVELARRRHTELMSNA